MKKIGIIGGAGPLASALLLQNIVHECYSQGCVNETSFPAMMLINHPFSISLCTQQSVNHRPMICDVLQACIDNLTAGGAQVLAIACNTFHLFTDELTTNNAHLVHIAQATLQEAQQQKLSRLLVLGTPLTLRNSLYHHPTITCVAPPEHDQIVVEHIINRILAGKVLAHDARMLSTLIERMHKQQNFDGIVLGCTELPVLHNKHPLSLASATDVVVLDTLDILAKHVVNKALN
jgi:aspartate racemase